MFEGGFADTGHISAQINGEMGDRNCTCNDLVIQFLVFETMEDFLAAKKALHSVISLTH